MGFPSHLGDSDVWEVLPGKGQVTLDIFANDWLLVMTGNIVPFDSITIKVVENGHASLFVAILLDLFTVIWLGTWWTESSSS